MTTLLAAAAVVVLLYLLRPPARRIAVPSTLLWRRLVEESRKRRRWLRWLLSLLLSTLIVLLLVSVLFRIEPRTGSLVDPVLLIDNTGSMSARIDGDGGATRLDAARTRALELVERSTGTVTLADLAGAVGPERLQSVGAARQLLDGIRPEPLAEPRIPHLPRDLRNATTPPPIFVLTDRVEALSALVAERGIDPASVRFIDLSQPGANVGVLRFVAETPERDSLGGRAESAFLEIVNGTDAPTTVRLRVDFVAEPEALANDDWTTTQLLERTLELAGSERWSAALDLRQALESRPFQSILFRAHLDRIVDGRAAGDAQPLDDEAWLRLPASRVPVRWSAPGRPPEWLDRVLRTSERLTPLPGGSGPTSVLALAPAPAEGASPPPTPCLLLPAANAELVARELEGAVLQLPGAPPLTLPWTGVSVVADAAPPRSPLWLAGSPAASADGAAGAAGDAATIPLVVGPADESSCARFLVEPVGSGLETRAELPAVLEAILEAVGRDGIAAADGNGRRQWTGERWSALGAGEDYDPRSTLRAVAGRATPRLPLGERASRIGGPGSPAGNADSTLTDDAEGGLRWPGRTLLLLVVAGLLVAEAVTRVTGVTE